MATHIIKLSELEKYSFSEFAITYNADTPDLLALEFPVSTHYDNFRVVHGDKIVVRNENEVPVFAGTVTSSVRSSQSALSAETLQVTASSDGWVLEKAPYAKLNEKGEVVYARSVSDSKTTTLQSVVGAINSWLSGVLKSTIDCDVDAVIPTPTGNGTTPCWTYIQEAMRWVPESVLVQRYSLSYNYLKLSTPDKLGTVELTMDGVLDYSIQERNDLYVPACALVGAFHYTTPSGADLRQPGTFIYAVPIDKEDEQQRGGAGNAPASAKMIVRGVALPENVVFEETPSKELAPSSISTPGATSSFVKKFFPELKPLLPNLQVGACRVDVVSNEDFKVELEDNSETDEDAKIPANYNANTSAWAAGGTSIYVHTEGSFPASSRKSRNVRGLSWCKGSLSIYLFVQFHPTMNSGLRKMCELLMPGRMKRGTDDYYYVKKSINCNFISRRKKIFDVATARVCSTDPDFKPTEDEGDDEYENPNAADYINALNNYYRAASGETPIYEGSVSVVRTKQSLRPWQMSGQRLHMNNFSALYGDIYATIRSVFWDVKTDTLSISFGSRDVLGFSEFLERGMLARKTSRRESQKLALDYDPDDEPAQKEAENEMSVSPSVSVSTDTSSSGTKHPSFSLYVREDDGVVVLAGGEITRMGQTLIVNDTDVQIIDGVPTSTPWALGKSVRMKIRRTPTGIITYDLYQS
jgi:hypothetical protein